LIPFYPSSPSDGGADGLDSIACNDLPTHRIPTKSSGTLPDQPLHVTFFVWKPRPDFKKSAPGPPDFRVTVLDARCTEIPTLHQIDELLSSIPFDPPPQKFENQVYKKLKHGWKNIILAIVDQGVVGYVRIGDSGFGHEKLYARHGISRGGKYGRGRGGGASGRGKGK
jgi:tRNA-splicing endonuclease subunit Sen54